jgi:hypothetical protein
VPEAFFFSLPLKIKMDFVPFYSVPRIAEWDNECFFFFLSGAPFSLTLHYTLTLAPFFASAGPGGGAAEYFFVV